MMIENKRSLMLYYYDIRKYFCCVKGIQYELLFTTSIRYYLFTSKKDIKSQSRFYAITENQLLLIASKISILSQVYLFSILSVRHVVIIILTHDLFLLTNR